MAKSEKNGKNQNFTQKIANISKTKRPILKNSTAIEFFGDFTYNTRFLSKSVHNCRKSNFFETPPLNVLPLLVAGGGDGLWRMDVSRKYSLNSD